MPEAVIIDCLRTPVGKAPRGTLRETRPDDLAATVLKALIDRSQTLWSRKYVFRLKDPLAATRKGLLFSVAASRGRQLFEGIHLTVKYFFDAIDAQFDEALTYRGIEAKGAIRQHEGVAADIDAAIARTVLPLVNRQRLLFISAQGACRAPMAAALAQQRFGDHVRASFGGWSPASALHEPMFQAMQQAGVDLGYRQPQAIDQAFYGLAPDLVIAIGADPHIQPISDVKTIQWPLPEPRRSDDQALNRLHMEIGERLDALMQHIEPIDTHNRGVTHGRTP